VGLTSKEKKLLENLTRKAEEPDAGPVSKSVNVLVDLKDAASVAMAKKFGFLPDDDDADDDDADGDADTDAEGDDTPKRRGYFPN
jgi:hypothetical protein